MPNGHSFGSQPSVPFLCLPHMLEHQARRNPDAPAILAPGRAPLSYHRLYRHVHEMGHRLRSMGIGRHDRIAVVLPNGPELAVAVLTVATSAACAPVNPAYRADELSRYFADLHPRALITQTGFDSPARRVALSLGVPVIELSTESDLEAGLFTLTGDEREASPDEPISASDTALLLPTSGTTGSSKIVPQRHAGMCASAYAHAAALALAETDRCLNVLPLFHGHGLHATLVASLAAGASVLCSPGFDVSRFSGWLTEFRPTWYSAVPTIHQAILAQARDSRERLSDSRLRFVRSSSASLPPRIFAELERVFEAPVIEWYGMTEVTSSPIACNTLPPRQRKAGSVGLPTILNVAIMDERGAFLPSGQTGQVVVRGASVTTGYDGNPGATEAAFAGDWFKTGDLGYFDDDGYLFLAGRIREMINRGGDKVTPQEVDEVLLDHPAVAEAVTFAVPHPTLGEDVAVAVVLWPHAAATSKEIRQFATGRIADFKVPRQVFIVDKIPKGPTGKVQRIRLAAELGLAADAVPLQASVAPRTPVERVLAGIWAEVLQTERVGVHDNFFALGGDSLRATRVLIRLHEIMQVEVEVSRIFETPTVAEIAEHIETLARADRTLQSPSTVPRVPRENGAGPASISQERLCALHHALPELPLFNIPYVLRLTSIVDMASLERSINEVVRRHEILRTTFSVVDGRYMQLVAPQLIVSLGFDDLRGLPPSEKEAIELDLIQSEVLHVFDLVQGPLIRTRLLCLAEQEYLLVICMHQVICDGWSLGVLAEELIALYDAFSGGKESPLAPPAIQFSDFAHWQRQWRSDPELVAQLEYWREQLRDPVPVTPLARSAPIRTVDGLRTVRCPWRLPVSLVDAAKGFSHEEGGTLFMALVAALKTLLHRYLGQDDVRVATNVANRNRPGTESLVGPLVNTVILRTNLGGDPDPREVMRRVRATTLAALAHQDLPFQELVKTLERECSVKPQDLVNVMILLQNNALRPEQPSARRLSFAEANPNMLVPLVTITTFDVILMLRECSDGLVGTCVYKPLLFRAGVIDRLLREFEQVLELMTTQPERPISEIQVSLSDP
jgi:acyl-CoA synthetase (AMP-forming)/AMP-acid ligase II